MLWNLLSLACFAEPPAESPSTTINSFTLLSFKVHTAIFPARGAVPFPTFFFSASLIFFIFSLLCAAAKALFIRLVATSLLSSIHSQNLV